jgi:hypothetical protein
MKPADDTAAPLLPTDVVEALRESEIARQRREHFATIEAQRIRRLSRHAGQQAKRQSKARAKRQMAAQSRRRNRP